MKVVYHEDILVPDIIGTSCTNSIKLKDVDFKVPCGKCLPCQKKRRSDWSLRLEHEYLFADSAFFVTLTYNDASVPRTKEGYLTLNKKHLQHYIKRLRNDNVHYLSKTYKVPKKEVKNVSKPIRYYAIGEYGSKTRRPHYHILIFNYDINNITPIRDQWKNTQTGIKYGHVDIGTVSGASINYVTKYMFKYHGKKDKRVKPFSLMSKKPIIGHAYLENYGTHHIKNDTLITADGNGVERRLPKAYIRRLFTDKEHRIELSLNSFKELQEKKLNSYKTNVEKHYSGKMLDYAQSKQSDLDRIRQSINNSETI